MNGTLTFNLPEEQIEFETAVNAYKYRGIISELDTFLRNKLKYSELTDEEYKVYDTVRQQLWNEINNENLDIH